MAQLHEATLQQTLTAFYNANQAKFRKQLTQTLSLAEYRLQQSVNVQLRLVAPVIQLAPDRRFQLTFGIRGDVMLSTSLYALPGGATEPPVPDLAAVIEGDFTIEIEGRFDSTDVDKLHLILDLSFFEITSIDIRIESADVQIGDGTVRILSALARRVAIYTLRDGVAIIPTSFALRPKIALLGGLELPLTLDYKVVASGGARALAILCRRESERVDWGAVQYALEPGQDIGIFFDFELINTALNRVEIFLENYSANQPQGTDPNNPHRHGTFTINDARFSVRQGGIDVENIELHLRLLDRTQRQVREIVCYLLGGACGIRVCDEVLRWVMEEVLQLDQIGNVNGWIGLEVRDGKIWPDPHLQTNYARWAWVFVPVTAGAIIPLGGSLTIIAMLIGRVFLNRWVNEIVSEESLNTIVDREIPSANLRVSAHATAIRWRPDNLGILGKINFYPAL